MSVNVETYLVDQGAFLHCKLNFVDKRQVCVWNLVVLNYEVRESDISSFFIAHFCFFMLIAYRTLGLTKAKAT